MRNSAACYKHDYCDNKKHNHNTMEGMYAYDEIIHLKHIEYRFLTVIEDGTNNAYFCYSLNGNSSCIHH